ncbi:MAG: hypothetical protein J0L58_09025 [Burkholderiales bacterium]|nr:hypothetical protein [Burkholderiales bacterium]
MKNLDPLLSTRSLAMAWMLTAVSGHAAAAEPASWRWSADLSWGRIDRPCPALGRCSPVELSGRLRLAHALSPHWALELGSLAVDGEWGLATAAAKVSGAGVALVGSLPVAADWSLLGRAGVASLRGSYRPEAWKPASTQARKTGPWFGGGLRWQLSPRWHVEAHADWARANLRLGAGAEASAHTVRWVGVGGGLSF